MANPVLSKQLPLCLQRTDFPALGEKYQGKVRDTYRKGDKLTLITTDRLSAFDHVLTTIPFKGEVLNRLAQFWFDKTKHVVKNHLIDVPDPNVAVARRCEPFAIEFVIRGYLTGSLWRDYQKGAHGAYGVPIPSGMKKDQAFEKAIITPSTKAPQGEHDLPISEKEILDQKLMSKKDWQRASEAAIGLFAEGQKWAKSRGLILVDTKYELGRTPDGKIVFIDEIHTPDSSRYWYLDDYEQRLSRGEEPRSLDKEYVRRWYADQGYTGHGTPPPIPDDVRVEAAKRYIAAYEQVTGKTFVPDTDEPNARIRKNLGIK